MKYFLPLFVLMVSCAHDNWTRNDTYRHIALTAVTAIDYLQTKEIVRNDDYIEKNPILGSNPSQAQVDAYFAASWLAATATAYLLPAKYRKLFQFACFGIESVIVIHNHAIGIRISF